MAISKSALDQDLEFDGRKVTFMQFAFLKRLSQVPGKGCFHSLWGGHWSKVLNHEAIFLNVSGFGGAYKYYYHETVEAHGLSMKVYLHCHGKYYPVEIIIHTGNPTVVVNHNVYAHDELPVKAIEWTYAATGNYLFSKFFWKDDARLVHFVIYIYTYLFNVYIIYVYIIYVYRYYTYYITFTLTRLNAIHVLMLYIYAFMCLYI